MTLTKLFYPLLSVIYVISLIHHCWSFTVSCNRWSVLHIYLEEFYPIHLYWPNLIHWCWWLHTLGPPTISSGFRYDLWLSWKWKFSSALTVFSEMTGLFRFLVFMQTYCLQSFMDSCSDTLLYNHGTNKWLVPKVPKVHKP